MISDVYKTRIHEYMIIRYQYWILLQVQVKLKPSVHEGVKDNKIGEYGNASRGFLYQSLLSKERVYRSQLQTTI